MTVFIYYKVFTHQPAWTNHVTHILSTPLPSYKSQGSPSCPVWLSGGLLITVVNVIIANDFRKHGHDRNSVTLRGKVRWMWERKGKADEDIHKILFHCKYQLQTGTELSTHSKGFEQTVSKDLSSFTSLTALNPVTVIAMWVCISVQTNVHVYDSLSFSIVLLWGLTLGVKRQCIDTASILDARHTLVKWSHTHTIACTCTTSLKLYVWKANTVMQHTLKQTHV